MYRMIYDYTKNSIERVSSDTLRFKRELKKALRNLLHFEIEKLRNWLSYFTQNKPDLQQCVIEVNF